MPEKWTGRLIGEMHNHNVTYEELAAELGVAVMRNVWNFFIETSLINGAEGTADRLFCRGYGLRVCQSATKVFTTSKWCGIIYTKNKE